VLYNRASADINGKPWDAKRMLIQWNGSKWTGNDIPDFNTAAPGSNTVYHAAGRAGAPVCAR
jgi:formate dehydrogenase-N alpha subunit